MLVSGIGVVVVVVCISRIDALIVDSGLRGEHGWSSRGDRVLLSSSECCRGRVFRRSGDAVLVVASRVSAAEDDTTRVARRSVYTSARHDSEPR
jgi:hypothetical protein